MYEFEVNHTRLHSSELSEEVKAQFKDADADITAIALIPWEEHCTECAMPKCYIKCKFKEY